MLLNEAVTGLLWKEFGLLVRIYSETCITTFLHFESLKEKDLQSTSQSHQDIMNCLKDLIPLWPEFKESLGVTARCRIMYPERIGAWLEHIGEIQNILL